MVLQLRINEKHLAPFNITSNPICILGEGTNFESNGTQEKSLGILVPQFVHVSSVLMNLHFIKARCNCFVSHKRVFCKPV